MQVNAAASTIVNNESMRTSSLSSNIAAGKLTSYSGKKKVAVKRESFCSPRTSVEILGPVRTNTCYDPRRAMSVDLTNGGFKSLARNGLKENSIKQRRWVWRSSSTKSKSLFHLLSTHATTIVAEVLEVLETQVPGHLSAAFRPQFCYPPCISTT